MDRRISVLQGDITTLAVDAIVNAAKNSLLGGGGVDGAIHRAAGPELLTFCRTLGGCETGRAKLSPGFNLPARHVIHTVGPVWQGGQAQEDELLGSCYRECLTLAHRHGFSTLAFPAISTGIYGFPADRAARIAVREIRSFLASHALPERIVLLGFDETSTRTLTEALEASPLKDAP
jgi:O-acetyl-ADP-ribose deacetylase (regulator of RNase III)